MPAAQPVASRTEPGYAPRPFAARVRDVVAERRLPYRVQKVVDAVALKAGLRHKTIRSGGLTLRVRRSGQDERMARNVLDQLEYTRDGYDIGETDMVIDIGGNVGAFATLAGSRAKRGRIVTFEPEAGNFALLESNVRRNGLVNVTCVHAAVAGTSGTLRLYDGGDSGRHSTSIERGAAFQEVPAVTLSEAMDRYGIDRCDFLKVDCEGAEYEIFESLPDAHWQRIRRVAMEYHSPTQAEKRQKSDWLAEMLERQGFRVTDYVDHPRFLSGFMRARR